MTRIADRRARLAAARPIIVFQPGVIDQQRLDRLTDSGMTAADAIRYALSVAEVLPVVDRDDAQPVK